LYLLTAFLLSVITTSHAAPAKTNALYQHPSPYLAMHGRDPVQWHEWNEATLAKARKQNKLLFVSSGYFSCHWCHVMQRESFQNEKIAALLNAHFIAVKVDREIDAALDAKLIDFVERSQGIAGWPLNVFVTPEGYPLAGMVYVPAEQLASILDKVASQWRLDRVKLKDMASAASLEVNNATVTNKSVVVPAAVLINALTTQSFQLVDELQGGFGDEHKFPSVPQLSVLLSIYAEGQDARIKKFLNTTLAQMASLGLRDQLGGGFYRYVVDPNWHIPHFEKMLYDNALLAKLYFDASVVLQEPGYAAVAQDTLDFMLREMQTAAGGFAASLSAVDAQGVEGGYYLWSDAELTKLLTAPELAAVRAFWQIEGAAPLDAGHHFIQPHGLDEVAKALSLSRQQLVELIEAARHKLLAARNLRRVPKDEKQLAGWNGLALSAFAAGYNQTKNVKYQQAAQAIVDNLTRSWWQAKTGTLSRLVVQKKSLSKGMLEDYAYLAQGLFDWWQVTNNVKDRILLERLLEQGWQRFYNQQGWQLAENMLLKYGDRNLLIKDGALPSPSAVLLAVSLRLPNSPYVAQAKNALAIANPELEEQAFWHATQIRNLLLRQQLDGS
jgi:hypothetical protein